MPEVHRTLESWQEEAQKHNMSESDWINGGFQNAGWKTWFSKTGERKGPVSRPTMNEEDEEEGV